VIGGILAAIINPAIGAVIPLFMIALVNQA
jgi:hypothetical protein